MGALVTEKTYLAAQCRCGAGGYLTPADAECAFNVPRYQLPEMVVDAVPVQAPPRTNRAAIHEAAHALFVHALGFQILQITADGQPHCAHGHIPDHTARVAIALAGDHGERLILHRLEYRPLCDEVAATFQVVREMRFGGCDGCSAAFGLFCALGSSAADEVLLAANRTVEAATIALIREPISTAAIRHLSEALMSIGTVSGPEVHRIFEEVGVGFGSRRITMEGVIHA